MGLTEYVFSGAYGLIGLALIILIIMQQGQDRNALGALSGGSSETFYAKNAGKSAEAKKKRWTKILAIIFVAMNAAYFFI